MFVVFVCGVPNQRNGRRDLDWLGRACMCGGGSIWWEALQCICVAYIITRSTYGTYIDRWHLHLHLHLHSVDDARGVGRIDNSACYSGVADNRYRASERASELFVSELFISESHARKFKVIIITV